MKRILLVGEYYSTNLGDNILCQCTEQYIYKKFPNQCECSWLDLTYGKGLDIQKKLVLYLLSVLNKLNLSALSSTMASLLRKYWVSSTLKRMLKNGDYNLILFAGGQMFMDYFSESILSVVSVANKYDIPVVFNACGVGRNSLKTTEWIKQALSFPNVKRISARDSLSFFSEIGIGRVSILPDIATLSAEILNVERQKSDIVGLGVLSPVVYNQNNLVNVSEERFFLFWRNVINFLEGQKRKWQLFANGSEDDYDFACRLLNHLNLSDGNLLAKRPASGLELMEIISSYKCIISYRLHSHIIAYSLSIPSIGIVWDNKLVEFGKMIQKENCFMSMIDFDTKCLDSIINENAEIESNFSLRYDMERKIEKAFVEYLDIIDR